jgi:hypothetical protein
VLLNKVKISCGLFWVDLVKLMESDPIYVPNQTALPPPLLTHRERTGSPHRQRKWSAGCCRAG